MKRIEEKAVKAGLSNLLMMENAGRSVADTVLSLYDYMLRPKVLAVCGTGNNGGDCVAAARHLHRLMNVKAILLGKLSDVKTEEASRQWLIAKNAGMKIYEVKHENELSQLHILFKDADIILDGIFGTGVRPPLREPHRSAILMINSSKALKISIDLPSGLDPDTGESYTAVNADITIALHSLKPGLLKRNDLSGYIMVKSLGIPFS